MIPNETVEESLRRFRQIAAENYKRRVNIFTSENLDSLQAVASSVNKFSAEFYKRLAEKNETEGNLICSPTCVAMALSMLQVGARNNTKDQFISALNLPADDIVINNAFQSLIENFNSMKKCQLNIANKIYVGKTVNIKPDFSSTMKSTFGSAIENVDFSDTFESCKKICTWCEEKTNNCIKNIVSEDELVGAEMILICAVYFKGFWVSPFLPEMQKVMDFYIDEKTTKQVLMMARDNSPSTCYELENLDAKCLALPYQCDHPFSGKTMTMYIILPNKNNSLKFVEENLNKINFSQLDRFKYSNVYLELPKFKFECDFDLTEILQKMGVKDAFEASADFTAIQEYSPKSSPLVIYKIIHKAFIEVNETGTEAAAVTKEILFLGSGGITQTICVNKPFLSVIVAEKTTTPIFIARIIDPTLSK